MLDTLLEPERRAEAHRAQAALRERMGDRVNRHPAQIQYLFGCAGEQQAMVNLERLYQAGEPDAATLSLLLTRLAGAYALQARFEEAANIEERAADKAAHQARAQAVATIGVRQCGCPPAVNRPWPGDAKGKNFPTQTVCEEVFDGKRIIDLTRCSVCRTISAREHQ